MPTSKSVIKNYLTLTLLSTMASSMIWGINTLFLLDAGLSNTQAFAANAFFTLGLVIFEVPTGVVADTKGRRTSYLIGTLTLLVSTLLYYFLWRIGAPFLLWAIASALLGFGFTFFSGATEAWLVDALKYTKFKGSLESVFAKGQVIGGVAMLIGATAGGVIAQLTNLGVPFIIRGVLLTITFAYALLTMRDLGFTPDKSTKPIKQMKKILSASLEHGIKNPPVKWVMLAAPFTAGAGIFAFYAMQPYLLELYGDPSAYGVAGVAASIVAGAQIVGGLAIGKIRKLFKKRTTLLAAGIALSVISLLVLAAVSNFWLALIAVTIWATVFSATTPVRQAYLNELIPSKQRATVLSFDSLVSSSGGVVAQPALGKVSDLHGYSSAYVAAGLIQIIALPMIYIAKKQKSPADDIAIN